MTQNQLDRSIAEALGEDLRNIRRMGFSIADPDTVDFDPEPCISPSYVDWDEVDQDRNVAWVI